MKITITQNEQEFDVTAAWRIIAQMLEKRNSVIGLSTGQTTIGMHRIVSEIYAKYRFDVSSITLFNVDELTNLSREYAGSCYTMILNQIAGPLGIPKENFIMPPTLSDDFVAEALLFEKRLAERGGADLQMLGIGSNGHIGINQPGTPFESETWVSPMDPDFEARVRRETQVPPETKLGGLTRGIKNIMQTRKLVLIAKGVHKADIIEQAILGPVTIDIPASVVQLHPNCEILLDADAGSKIAAYAEQRGYNW
ncbi:6-phosphogluconolactonase [Mucilaginibacter sp. L3T2-6]|uniref:6-phosphogluconolactonase n=1 Tax=Mucilaginibacter sp. L3T2-6 TaxID=3062491 RepID=UPI002674B06C|nr:6-phosphogluconolactonase [Mucilaginibacter sp. L3T2-6]MDO3642372.1 6-phosphogluconolactonase [Mucilaginibacter sp. L3T2-6]MDV6214867.1 6-phosphogluconolactonase [Mucilaginibacter sp. L3T2-6]